MVSKHGTRGEHWKILNLVLIYSVIGGRLTLVKFVLETIPIFWQSSPHSPKGALERVINRCFHFLWLQGCKEVSKIPLVK
jgi:hypothetical protein